MVKIKKIVAVATLFAVMLVMSTPSLTSAYSDLPGGTTQLNKYLILDSGTATPNTTFEFEVAAGSGSTPGTGEMTVTPGISPDKVTVSDAVFTPSDSATAAIYGETGQSATNKIAAKKAVTVDFSQVNFNKPGVYRYIISEKAPSAPFQKVSGKDVLTVDVYVENDFSATSGLKIAGYVSYEGTVNTNPTSNGNKPSGAEKSDKFLNTMATYTLSVEKQISGNQADLDDEFSITLKLTGIPSGDKVKVDAANTSVTGYSAEYTADASREITITLDYGNAKNLTVTGIPSGTGYAITEDDANTNGYTTKYQIGSGAEGDSATGTLSANTSVKVKNTKQGAVPTGIITKILPGVILIVIAALLLARRRRYAGK